ncbi:MAG TPA: biotin/lipoyl-containing protein [Dehalococcoidia bacterium]|nr:biotin/lipoyl-containing protein [Dehalococcoidia bacterium]
MPQEKMEAPLPGKILSVKVKAGDKVAEGDELLSIEAMKMENPILSPVSGEVKEVNVTQGQSVKAGDILALIEY